MSVSGVDVLLSRGQGEGLGPSDSVLSGALGMEILSGAHACGVVRNIDQLITALGIRSIAVVYVLGLQESENIHLSQPEGSNRSRRLARLQRGRKISRNHLRPSRNVEGQLTTLRTSMFAVQDTITGPVVPRRLRSGSCATPGYRDTAAAPSRGVTVDYSHTMRSTPNSNDSARRASTVESELKNVSPSTTRLLSSVAGRTRLKT